MTLHDLPQRVDRLSGFDALLSVFQSRGTPRGHGQIIGLAGAAKSLLLARLYQRREEQMLLLTYQTEQAQRLWDDLRHFGIPEERLFLLPASESRWLTNDVTDYRALGERIAALSALGAGAPCIVIGTADAVFQRTSPPEDIVAPTLSLRVGETVALGEPLCRLPKMGSEWEPTAARPARSSRAVASWTSFPARWRRL